MAASLTTKADVSLETVSRQSVAAIKQEDSAWPSPQMRQPLGLCILRPKPEPTETQSLLASNGEDIGASLDPPGNHPQDPKTGCTFAVSSKTEQDASVNTLDQRCEPAVEEMQEPIVSKRDQRTHACSYCGKSITRAANLRTHIRRVHLNQRTHACSYCGKAFAQPDSLRAHTSFVHLNQRMHVCSYCGKSFPRAATLRTHIRCVHFKERTHICEYCEKSFFDRSQLHVHVNRVHLNKRPHTCELCEYSFTRKGDLRRHIRAVHMNQRPHTCELCEHSFTRKSDLRGHIRAVHMNKRPFVSEHSDKSFTPKGSSRTQIRSVHSDPKQHSHRCEQCDRSFKQHYHLLLHHKTIHLNKSSDVS